MTSQRDHVISIGLALTVVAGAMLVTYGLYTYFGIGSYRYYFALFEGRALDPHQESEPELAGFSGELFSPVDFDLKPPEEPEPVSWVGSAEDPARLVFFGTSMTRRGVLPRVETELRTRLHFEEVNFAWFDSPLDRCYDLLRVLTTVEKPDVVVIEHGLILVNDHMLLRRESQFANAARHWHSPILDADLLHLRRALGAENEQGRNATLRSRFTAKVQQRWENALRDPQRGANPRKSVGYRQFSNVWEKKTGSRDLTVGPAPLVRTNYLSQAALRKIVTFCRSEGIGLVVYVPPRSPSWRSDPGGEIPRIMEAASYSAKALRVASEILGFKVLDCDAWSDDTGLFKDELHLVEEGAELFTADLFAALARFFETAGQDLSYETLVQDASR